MATAEMYNVDATALFRARPQPERNRLITHLSEKLGDSDCGHIQISPLSHADWWLLASDTFHIMVSFSDQPATGSEIAKATNAPVTTLQRFDYLQMVETHKSHVSVEIGDGNAPLPPEARAIMQEFGPSSTCDPDLKMRVLHWTVQFIAAHEGLLGVYFGPSERLFSPQELSAAADQDLPLALLFHPDPTLPEQGPHGRDGYHVRLRNSRHLPGPALELEGIPPAIPFATAVSLLHTLFHAHLNGKVTFEHGKLFQPSQKVRLYVREALPDEQSPNGRLILSFWKGMGHDAPKPIRPKRPEPPQPDPEPVPVTPVSEPVMEMELEPAAPEPEKIPEIISIDPEDVHKYREYMTEPVEETLVSRISSQTLAPSKPREPEAHRTPEPRKRAVPIASKARSAMMAMALGFGLFFVPYGSLAVALLDTLEANKIDLAGIPSGLTTFAVGN